MGTLTDLGSLSTAKREAHEEVGLVLGRPLGKITDVLAIRPRGALPMVVAPWVFLASASDLPVVHEPDEVAATFWVPWKVLTEPANRGRESRRAGGFRLQFPCIRIGQRSIWGLTLRMVDDMQSRADAGNLR